MALVLPAVVRRWRFLRGTVVLALGIALFGPSLRAADADEAATRNKLEAIKAAIAAETRAREQVKGEQVLASQALREIETATGAAARRLAEIEDQVNRQTAELAELDRQRAEREADLAGQRQRLAELLRAAYAIGRDQDLRAWLARDRLGESERLLALSRYLQGSRLREVQKLQADLAALAKLSSTISAAQARLTEERAAAESAASVLAAKRAERQRVLAELAAQVASHDQRLRAYARDQKMLSELLARLNDVFADIPPGLTAAQAFAPRRGRLPRPIAGKVLQAFGAPLRAGRQSEGWLIAASVGSPVRAVARGRVAYADWLNGFGLLIILDHGDGYMSLYARNEALLRDVGDWVDQGSAIARSGDGGGNEPPALYFELRRNGQPLDPKVWLAAVER
ncbi:MAG: murein hydrolase activator EnvC [Lysobacterales bacterium]